MKRCQSKGCTNIAFGCYEARTPMGRLIHLDLCSPCGVSAHSKRKMRVEQETGREYESYPRMYKSVELVEVYGDSYDGPKIIKQTKHSMNISQLLKRRK